MTHFSNGAMDWSRPPSMKVKQYCDSASSIRAHPAKTFSSSSTLCDHLSGLSYHCIGKLPAAKNCDDFEFIRSIDAVELMAASLVSH